MEPLRFFFFLFFLLSFFLSFPFSFLLPLCVPFSSARPRCSAFVIACYSDNVQYMRARDNQQGRCWASTEFPFFPLFPLFFLFFLVDSPSSSPSDVWARWVSERMGRRKRDWNGRRRDQKWATTFFSLPPFFSPLFLFLLCHGLGPSWPATANACQRNVGRR